MKALIWTFLLVSLAATGLAAISGPLPEGIEAEWDLAQAFREATPGHERICINGLWRWQPANGPSIPEAGWGYFKVPGPWPGITDYMQKDCQTLLANDAWKSVHLEAINSAWYQREIVVPETWRNHRIRLSTEYLNSFAVCYLDGQKVGEARFPGGEIDLTDFCRPGARQLLTLMVTAMPLKAVLLSYTDSASARQVQGSVPRRGLCGDVFLEAESAAPRIGAVRIQTSVRKGELVCDIGLQDLPAQKGCRVLTTVRDGDQTAAVFASPRLSVDSIAGGVLSLTNAWKPARLWDVHTPGNQYAATFALIDENGAELDHSLPIRFGFRELWIDGRDFYLNGTRIFLSAVPLDNAQVGAAWSTYAMARESLSRLKSFGINFVYTHNYGCEPGSHLSFEEILRAADDEGVLVALSQPHFSHYDWKSPGADESNGYAAHARFYAKVAGNHPSVAFYSMSHNATGYGEDMNPDRIGEKEAPRDNWAQNNARLALRAEKIVEEIDPSRIVYHHASGSLGSMHPMNFYPNFVPPQELSDWFGPWSTNGVKPAFLCEYGAPFTWDWTMYRGWYQGEREFGSAKVPWEFCVAEWNAQFIGDPAYRLSEPEKANLRWEAKQFRAGNLWHRWDYPFPVGSDRFDERYPIFASYLTDNWRAFRGWGVSAVSPWEYEHFWKLRPGLNRRREELPVDWHGLQRPGYSPDYIAERYERMDLAYRREDWIATPAAAALIRNNQPILAFIAGKPEAFTSKDHNFLPGESVEKQLILINNSRKPVSYSAEWALDLPSVQQGSKAERVETGDQVRLPLRFSVPTNTPAGSYVLRARVTFEEGEPQEDSFTIQVLPPPSGSISRKPMALFDPAGETEATLRARSIPFSRVDANADLSGYETLVIGKGALALEGPAPDISAVRNGLKVIVFEQRSEVLEKRLGFRVAEYGLRQLFPRVPDHPILRGLQAKQLKDWRGHATLLPARLAYEMRPRYGPTVRWCDLAVPRLWRCGNRGNVASVLIEKPPRGDFLPILDGGYAEQYSALLEYREGKGLILFCQLDLTGRTESDPAAENIARNILDYAAAWKPAPKRKAYYGGSPEGHAYLQSLGVDAERELPTALDVGSVLILGSGAGTPGRRDQATALLQSGGRVLGLALSATEMRAILPIPVNTARAEHIGAYFPAPGINSAFRGVAPADLHCREPMELDSVTAGAEALGDGAIAASENQAIVLFQLLPWAFGDLTKPNIKRTFRRASFALARTLANLGVESATPLLDRFHSPVTASNEKRWLSGLYLDAPEEWDDPYRFFRW